ncbi:SusC/RagA family TonB-linked outer membrane protein [Reichenbachiella ulvae]|uniref:TonB-dependent receptor n=1 Tax=Reichenbachiella ulvae TaxID=2980104 RepID=A0ABT3CT73_9BACT|nr:TonB-dependent receptor [Reichenbachiella ulvae]MCV9386670.1 TonB-dependent receptor [Reichenbachiella ulvae]
MKRKTILNQLKNSLLFLLCLAMSVNLQAQDVGTIKGKIKDSDGQFLPGVTVLEKGTTNGTITDLDGTYTISASPNAILVFTFVGMTTQEVPVDNRSVLDITLESDMIALDEIVVVGYGEQKKENLTGSVSTISADEMTTRPVTNLSAGLSGMAAGVSVVQNSGATAGGDGATIRIRGVGTMNNSNPLVVVDGVPSEGTSIMNDIDPNDIANISILKDAASASIYGSRGANGVILITTKRGESGKPRLTYNGYYGVQKIPRMIDYVSDFADYMELANYIRPNEQIFSAAEIQEWRDNPNDPLNHPNVNWYEEVYGGTAPIMNHSLGYSGGNERTQYRFSLSYLDQDGIISGNSLQRYGVRTNLSTEVAKGLKIGGNVFFRWTNEKPNNVNTSIQWVPNVPTVRHPDGRWGGPQSASTSGTDNPYAELANRVHEENNRKVMGDVFAEWEVISGLKATAKVSLNFGNNVSNQFFKRYDLWDFNRDIVVDQVELGTGRRGIVEHKQDYLVNTNFLLDYSKSFDNHNFNLLGGYEGLQFRSDQLKVERRQFPNNEVTGLNAGLELNAGNGTIAEWSMESYFGRINYDYNGKYLLEANLRADGSSRFKEGNRWGYFPSFSAGWNLSEEAFMSGIRFLDHLKVRASWGQLGNNRVGNYPYQPTYGLNQNYSFNGVVSSGIAQTALTNEEIVWEETTTTDFGIDAAFFEGKLSLTADYFIRDTEGILTELPIPYFLGNKDEPVVNLASMRNKGYEFVVGYRDAIGELKYNVSANLTIIDNEVTDYFADIKTGGTQIGYAYDSYFGYEVEGIFKTQEQLANAATHRANTTLGDLHIKDQITEDTDGDGVPDAANGVIGSEDQVVIGNKIPKYTYGGNIGLNYKGFDFSMLIQGISKRDRNTWDWSITPMNWVNKGVIPQRWVDEEWSAQNPDGTLPRMSPDTRDLNIATSDFWVKDVSYLRVKNMQLGYDFTHSLLTDKNISKLRVYVSADNLFTFTNEEWGFDPETTNVRNFNVRTIIFGVNVGF